MISKFVSVSIVIWILSNCFANCLANCSANHCPSGEYWRNTEKLQMDCEKFCKFQSCLDEIAANGKATKVEMECDQLNKFPTELFGAFRNMKELEVARNPLTQEDLLGANQLEKLHLWGGQLNLSASLFANAPKLKVLSIDADVVYIDPQAFSGASTLRSLMLEIKSNATLPERLFDGLTNLQLLDLYRRVKDWEMYSFDNINEINIKNLRIPADNNIKFLNLFEGNITELKSEMLVNLTQLTVLLMERNRIERIRPYTFKDMNQLILLNLSFNKIEEITQAMLSGLTNLRTANFRGNNIRQIEGEAFSSTPQLRRLVLSDNDIVIFKPVDFKSFSNPPNLSYLDLSGSRYIVQYNDDYRSPVDFYLFCNLPNLSYLDLSHRAISMLIKCVQSDNSRTLIDLVPEETPFNTTLIEELLFEWQYYVQLDYYSTGADKIDLAYIDGLHEFSPLLDQPRNTPTGGSKLAVLNLQFNNLSDWEDNLFDNFVNLKLLNLEYNPIRSLRSGQFNGLGNLLILRLSSCYLTSLDFSVFSPLTNLKELHLPYNDITTMTPPEMSMNRLVVLDLSSNRFLKTSLDTEAFRSAFNWTELGLHRYGD